MDEQQLKKIFDHRLRILGKKLWKQLTKELGIEREKKSTRIKRIVKNGDHKAACRRMQLQFRNKISSMILTGEEIKGEENAPMEVALVDDLTGEVVKVEPEASASLEIVLLKGDNTAGGFSDNIVRDTEGKMPLLAGNVPLKLHKGIGVLKNIKLRHRASKLRPSVFCLGARVIDAFSGDQIKEAKTESFTVKDFRQKYYKKHKTPSLNDEVCRLKNIRKGGVIYKRLKEYGIHTVEDFLIRILKDPEGLKGIVNLGGKKWKDAVANAQACSSGKRMYCYTQSEYKSAVVFDILGRVSVLYYENQYAVVNMLSENHKAIAKELLESAYEHWGDVKCFDHDESLQEHLARVSQYQDCTELQFDSPEADYQGLRHVNTETPMIGKSSSRSNFSVQSISSAIDATEPICLEDCIPFSTMCLDDEESFLEHLASSRHVKTETSMIGESSSRLNFSVQSIISAMNGTEIKGVEDSIPFSIYDCEIVDEALLLNYPPFP